MAVATEPQVKDKLYIDGEWVDPAGTETIDVVNASTEEVMGRIPQGTPEDVDRAVAAARRAFETWSQTEMAERAEMLRAIAAGLAARADEIAATVSQELGMPIGLSKAIQAGPPTKTLTSANGHDLVHGLDARGPACERARLGARQAGRARARRQVAERDPRRRGTRDGRDGRRRKVLPQLRADLQRAHPHAGPACAPGRG